MKTSKKVMALIMAIVMLSTTFIVAASAVDSQKVVPSIIVPGLFQSETKYYEDGKATNLEAPFFMGDTMELVGVALTDALVPISKMLISQEIVHGENLVVFMQKTNIVQQSLMIL